MTRVENNWNVSKPVIIRFNGGSSRPIDHVGDITILVGVTHPVPRRLLSQHSLNEERGVGAVLALKSHYILQSRVKDIIPEQCSPLIIVVITSPRRTVDLSRTDRRCVECAGAPDWFLNDI